MSRLQRTELERVRYRQGQMLRSRDLSDQMAVGNQLRWWHNRAIHAAYGVAEGLEIGDLGLDEQGWWYVPVMPGLAYDCFGRELLLQREGRVTIPVKSSDPDVTRIFERPALLLIRYRAPLAGHGNQAPPPLCDPLTGGRAAEQAELALRRVDCVDPRDGVPLAEIGYDGRKFTINPWFTAPRARPDARPHIASGSTIPGATAWELWPTDAWPRGGKSDPPTLQLKLDTSAAGFTEPPTPCYFAWLQGPLWKFKGQEILAGGVYFDHVENVSARGFTYHLIMESFTRSPATFYRTGAAVRAFLVQNDFFVCWLGIQHGPAPGGTRSPAC